MPDPFPAEADRVMVASAGVLTAPDPEINAELASDGTAPVKKKRKKLGFGFWFSVIWIFLVVFGAAFAPWLPIDNPNVADPCAGVASTMVNTGATPDQAKLIFVGQATSAQQAQTLIDQGMTVPADVNGCKNPTLDSRVNAYPSATHILGTDTSGRDTFSRLIWGARVAITVGIGAIAVGMLLGGIMGLLAGFYRGKPETLLMTVADIMLAYPALILAIAFVAFAGQSLLNVGIAITIVSIPAFARIARASTLTYAEREFVMAARVMGAKNSRIIMREIFPNVILPVTAFALVAVAIAIVAEGALAFLGLSVPLPTSSWGTMIHDGYNVITDRPLVALTPAIIMFITVLAFNLLGDKFRTIFDVKDTAL
jgi:peptide/nickel transport system permease protein